METWAIRYAMLEDDPSRYLHLAVLIAGAAILVASVRPRGVLGRGPYFVLTAVAALLSALGHSVWLGLVDATRGHYLSVLMLVDLSLTLLAGGLIGFIAVTRGRDVFDDAKMGVLAFIPLGNLALFFGGSKPSGHSRAVRWPRVLEGPLALLAGLTIIAGVFWLYIYDDEQTTRLGNSPGGQAVIMELLATADGVPAALAQMQRQTQVPFQVNSTTNVVAIAAHGNELDYTYVVSTPDADVLLPTTPRSIAAANCASALRPLIDRGAILVHRIQRPDGREIGTVRVSARECSQR